MTTHLTPLLISRDKQGRLRQTRMHVSLDAQMLMDAATLRSGQTRTRAIFQALMLQGSQINMAQFRDQKDARKMVSFIGIPIYLIAPFIKNKLTHDQICLQFF